MKQLNETEIEQVTGGLLTTLGVQQDWSWLVPWYDAAIGATADALCNLTGRC